MIPRLNSRRIGSVNIFELNGIFAEPWVERIEEGIKTKIEEKPAHGLLFNLKEVERVDRHGAESILEVVRGAKRNGILGHNLSTYFVAEHMSPNEPIPIFENGTQAIGYFKNEFAEPDPDAPQLKRRKFPRIHTALPMEFELREYGSTFFFEAVVTNLSEGGLFCYFLDSQSEELATRTLDPFDLKLLDLRLMLTDSEILRPQGKVLRMAKELPDVQGLAIEFYNMSIKDQEKLYSFLKQEGEGRKREEKK